MVGLVKWWLVPVMKFASKRLRTSTLRPSKPPGSARVCSSPQLDYKFLCRSKICRFKSKNLPLNMSGVKSKRNQYWAYMEKSLRATTWRQSKCSHSESMFDTQSKQWLTSVLLCWNDLWPTGAIPRRITDVQFCNIFSSPTETLLSFHIYLCLDSKDL